MTKEFKDSNAWRWRQIIGSVDSKRRGERSECAPIPDDTELFGDWATPLAGSAGERIQGAR